MKYDKKEVYEFLKDKSIPFSVTEHEPVYTIEDMKSAGITQINEVCKNLFLRDQKGKTHYLVILPEDKQADLKRLSKLLESSRLSFASEKRLEKYLGLTQGSVSPLGILNDVNSEVIVVVDNTLKDKQILGIHPNVNTATVWIGSDDLFNIIRDHDNKMIFLDI